MDAILAALGGTDAFHVLLEGLLSSNAEAAKAAAIAVRQRVREADARARRSYLVETEKFLRKADKIAAESRGGPVAVAAAVKILGYLEDEKAVPTLLEFSKAKRNDPSVRQEALIALRFVLAPRDGDRGRAKATPSAAEAVGALVAAAEDPDRSLAQTALHTLASLRLPPTVAKRLEKLTGHPDLERARLAIEMVGRQAGEAHAAVLVNVIATTPDKRRAEIASQCLVEPPEGDTARTPGATPVRKDAVGPLAKALVETTDADRAWLLRTVLRPSAKDVQAPLRKQILATAIARLDGGVRGWEPLLAAARDADPRGTADALRAQAAKLKKSGPDRALRVLRALCQSDACNDDDRYDWAVAELSRGARDTRPGAREADESLRLLSSLLARGVDVGSRLRKDRGVDLEHLYYVGFHFAETGSSLGNELLQAVVDRGGRAKIAKMAKSKLALAG